MHLDLHRAQRVPAWAALPPAERNIWQRVAAVTRGVLTPANVVTAIGFALALWGIAQLLAAHYWLAILLLALGRLLDIADGVIANHTGTIGPLGELLDAAVDKIITVLTVAGLFLAHVAPAWLLGIFVLPHVVIVVIVAADRYRGVELHPSRLGKTTMLLAWIAIPLLLLTKALGLHTSNLLAALVMLFVLIAAAFGFITAHSYLNQSQRPHGS